MEAKALSRQAFSGSRLPEPGFLSCPPPPPPPPPPLPSRPVSGEEEGGVGNAPSPLKPPTQGRPRRPPDLLPCLGRVSKHSLWSFLLCKFEYFFLKARLPHFALASRALSCLLH